MFSASSDKVEVILQRSADTVDRPIIRNLDYFSTDFPQGPPAF